MIIMVECIFDLEIFSYDSIKKTEQAYKDYAYIKEIRTDSAVILRFDKCKYPEDITVKEFENYLICVENA